MKKNQTMIYQSSYEQGLSWFSEASASDILDMMKRSGPGTGYTMAGADILRSRGIIVHPKLSGVHLRRK